VNIYFVSERSLTLGEEAQKQTRNFEEKKKSRKREYIESENFSP